MESTLEQQIVHARLRRRRVLSEREAALRESIAGLQEQGRRVQSELRDGLLDSIEAFPTALRSLLSAARDGGMVVEIQATPLSAPLAEGLRAATLVIYPNPESAITGSLTCQNVEIRVPSELLPLCARYDRLVAQGPDLRQELLELAQAQYTLQRDVEGWLLAALDAGKEPEGAFDEASRWSRPSTHQTK